MIERERKRLNQMEKSTKLAQLQRAQAYTKDKTLKRNQDKILRGRFLGAYRKRTVNNRRAKIIEHQKKREHLQQTFHKLRRTKNAEIADDACLKQIVKLA